MLAAENAEKKIEIEKDNTWIKPKKGKSRVLSTVGGSNLNTLSNINEMNQGDFYFFIFVFIFVYVYFFNSIHLFSRFTYP